MSVGHERRDVWLRPLVLASVGLVVALALTAVGMRVLLDALVARRAAPSVEASSPRAVGRARQVPPEPRLQARPIDDLRSLRAAEQRVLEGYGWVDREQGRVHIPIERAMELLAAHEPAARGGR